MKRTLLAICLLGLLFQSNYAQTVDSLMKDGIELRKQYKDSEALAIFEQVLAIQPDNYEALWSASLMSAWIGNREDNKDKKKLFFNASKDYAVKAMNIDSAAYYSNYVMAVAIGRMALISSTKERVGSAKIIKFYADKAILADSTEPGGWGLLGRWHHKLLVLNFAERAAAKLLFGGLPEGASKEKALYSFKKAIEIKPNFILYKRDYVKALYDFGFNKEASIVAKEVIALPSLTRDDDKYKKEMKDYL